MTGPKGNSEFCFPSTLNVPRGEAEGSIEGRGETKLTIPRGAICIHQVFCYTSQLNIEQYTDCDTEFAAVSKVRESKVQSLFP